MQPPKFYQRAKEIAARVQGPAPLFAKKSEKRGELFIYSDIGTSWFSEGITAQHVADKLAEMKGVDSLDIYINSPGGEVFEGVAILAQLDRFPAKKTVHVDGIAASIASVIAMAGDRIVMHKSATMMIHDPWTMTIGDAADHREQADLLDKLGENILSAYRKHAKGGDSAVRDLMHAETWMGAEEAIEHGFAHEMEPDKEPEHEPDEEPMPMHRALTPAELVAKARADYAHIQSKFGGASPAVPPGEPGKTSITPGNRQKDAQR